MPRGYRVAGTVFALCTSLQKLAWLHERGRDGRAGAKCVWPTPIQGAVRCCYYVCKLMELSDCIYKSVHMLLGASWIAVAVP